MHGESKTWGRLLWSFGGLLQQMFLLDCLKTLDQGLSVVHRHPDHIVDESCDSCDQILFWEFRTFPRYEYVNVAWISDLLKQQVKYRQVRWIALYGQQTYGKELCLIRARVVLRRRWNQCCIRDCLPSWSDPGSALQTSSSFAEPVPVAGRQFFRRLCSACRALVAW